MLESLVTIHKFDAFYSDLNSLKKPLFVIDNLIKKHFPKVFSILVISIFNLFHKNYFRIQTKFQLLYMHLAGF